MCAGKFLSACHCGCQHVAGHQKNGGLCMQTVIKQHESDILQVTYSISMICACLLACDCMYVSVCMCLTMIVAV